MKSINMNSAMQKISLLIIIVVAIGFSECKKGENDPFLTLKSRTGRITGDWELVELETTSTSVSGGSSSTTITTFSGALRTTTTTTGGSSSTSSTPYSFDLTIEKKGAYESTETDSSGVESIKGAWYWAGKSKELELKDKEGIVFTELSTSSGSDSWTGSGTLTPDEVYYIDKLKNKELIVKLDYSYTNTYTWSGSTYTSSGTVTGTMTFEKSK